MFELLLCSHRRQFDTTASALLDAKSLPTHFRYHTPSIGMQAGGIGVIFDHRYDSNAVPPLL